MTITPREIEKLKAIGYTIKPWESWSRAKAHAQSPEGMVATMAAKVRWMNEEAVKMRGVFRAVGGVLGTFQVSLEHLTTLTEPFLYVGYSTPLNPEVAVDDLFWKVP